MGDSTWVYLIGYSRILGQFYLWLQPVFGLMSIAKNMNVHTFLFIAVNLECIFAVATEYWAHKSVAYFSANYVSGCKFIQYSLNKKEILLKICILHKLSLSLPSVIIVLTEFFDSLTHGRSHGRG
jgi:hypothetical protein